VVSYVGVRSHEMKVLRTFGDDKSTFTTLLRGLSPLGDAFGRMTYEDSGARRRERGVAKSECSENNGFLGRKYGRETGCRWRARRTATQSKGRDT
jgi:hypothetical protein